VIEKRKSRIMVEGRICRNREWVLIVLSSFLKRISADGSESFSELNVLDLAQLVSKEDLNQLPE